MYFKVEGHRICFLSLCMPTVHCCVLMLRVGRERERKYSDNNRLPSSFQWQKNFKENL